MRDTTLGTSIDDTPERHRGSRGLERARLAQRDPDDDFYCIRFDVWYPSIDCAYRTKFNTAPGCLNCEQGRFNFKRHATALHGVRFPFAED